MWAKQNAVNSYPWKVGGFGGLGGFWVAKSMPPAVRVICWLMLTPPPRTGPLHNERTISDP